MAMKPIFITWQDGSERPRVLRIPLWIVAAPPLVVVALAMALRVVWDSPWSPRTLRERMELSQSRNERVQAELERGEAGLSEARKAIRLERAELERLRGLAGQRASSRDSAGRASGIFVRDSVPDVGRLLSQARSIRQGYDQMIDWFQRHPTQVGRIPTIRPVRADRALVGDFGAQTDPFTGQSMEYPGATWAAPVGTPVWATGAGTVVATGDLPRWGKHVKIRHDERVITFYAHLSRVDAKEGESVGRGQVIGLSGQSGKVIAPAVFYAVFLDGKPIDPHDFLLPESRSEPAEDGL